MLYQSAISLSKNQTHHEKTKHINIKLHFIRLEVLKAIVKLQKIHTDKNVADILTKLVTTTEFKLCLKIVEEKSNRFMRVSSSRWRMLKCEL